MLPFTPRLRLAIANAEALASSQERLAVSPADLLAGVLSLGSGVAVGVLKAVGFTERDAAPVARQQDTPADSRSYDADALRALSEAFLEAARMSHQLVGIEHMLVGILATPSEEISAIFRQKNIKLEELLSTLRSEM
jgi:ATP-dependent Clp protease ATP-binding subunit ClpA